MSDNAVVELEDERVNTSKGFPVSAHNRHTAGRFLQSLAIARGQPSSAIAFAESQGHWLDRDQVVAGLKTAVSAIDAADFDGVSGVYQPVAESFLAAMRPFSVLQRLQNLRRVPMRTQVLATTSKIIASEIAAGSPIPVVRMTLAGTLPAPRNFAAILVQTNDLMRSSSPQAALSITNDLAEAVALAEDTGFLHPGTTGSVLNGAGTFTSAGSTVTGVDSDLRGLVERVPGCFRPGACFVMSPASAAYLGTLRDSDGAAAYPNIGPAGGSLLGLPVLTTTVLADEDSPPTRYIALIDPNEIILADEGRVSLTTSGETAIEMLDDPSNTSVDSTAAANMVSLFQANCTATKAVHEIAFYARSGAGAYFLAGY